MKDPEAIQETPALRTPSYSVGVNPVKSYSCSTNGTITTQGKTDFQRSSNFVVQSEIADLGPLIQFK